MNSETDASRQTWFMRNRMALLALAVMLAYAGFIQWAWGWPVLLAQFVEIGILPLLVALGLLTSTYFLRCWRIRDYFPRETAGRFLALFRVTQVHNLLNIMLPFRAGETSFPLLMRSEFGMPLARATAALLVMRLLDLHALFAAAGVGLVIAADNKPLAWSFWVLFLVSPVGFYLLKRPLLRLAARLLPVKLRGLLAEIDLGMPASFAAFLRAWLMTVVNWGVKVVVLAWALQLMGVLPLAATFGGALGGELSSVLPVHAPGGVGTYPAGIAAGAISFGAPAKGEALTLLGKASVNAHLLIVVSALCGTGLSLLLSPRGPKNS